MNHHLLTKRTLSILAVGSVLSGLLAGCGGSKTDNNAASSPAPAQTKPAETAKAPDPVELNVTIHFMTMTDEEFDNIIRKPLKAKYPHITLKVSRDDIVKQVAAGQTPDIVFGANSRYYVLQDLDLPADLSGYIKNSKLDLNKFANPNMDWIKELGTKGEIFALPLAFNHMALYYNKDLFDKRGVAYPKDGLVWEDYMELVKKLTYSDGGVQYRGTIPSNPEFFARTKMMPLVDTKTNKALVDTAAFKSAMEYVQQFYQIPGMIVDPKAMPNYNNFFVDQQSAMVMEWITSIIGLVPKTGPVLNYDITGAPTFKDNPGVTIDPGAQFLMMTKTSKHKDDAYKVIEYITSPEVQTILNRTSRLTGLADEAIRKDLLADVPAAKGKNIQGALKVKPQKMVPHSPYTVLVAGKINSTIPADLVAGKDINTILREVQEASDKTIAEEAARRQK
ncbi:MAG: family 1 extracellular solute-binding protein [Paenibacillus sp.]|nr:family 1 extracellular solute-binding protein [Paenibacillus sp.]